MHPPEVLGRHDQSRRPGHNFRDTANIYSFGASEEIVGRAIKQLTRRDDIMLATKVHHLPAAAAALDITLTDDEVTTLKEHYVLHEPTYLQSARRTDPPP
ncbi:aldo/keto reductase [Streptomyces phaeochromogenes]|uniref:aldo/keto reductase n=1 Tax=Streptomyces phaeochromogenes TaxID=1923 RepID=UPI0036A01411